MGWFDEQIRQRKKYDADILSDALCDIADAVTSEKVPRTGGNAKDEIDKILEFYGTKSRDLPGSIKDIGDKAEYLIRYGGIMKRQVTLKRGWHKDAAYPMLARLKDGTPTALIPGKYSGYFYTDKDSGRRVKVTAETEKLFENSAYCFYKPYPLKKLSERELLKNILGAVGRADIYLFVLMSAAALAISLIVPSVYRVMFLYIANGRNAEPLVFAALALICIAIGTNLITAVKRAISGRIKNKLELSCESAVMMRILSLPAAFFKKYGSGELSEKMQSVDELCEAISETVIYAGITSILSLAYFIWIAVFTRALLLPALITAALLTALSVILIIVQSGVTKKQTMLDSKEQGISYSLISGISKIKLVGGEARAFAKWGRVYAEKAKLMYNPPLILRLGTAVHVLITVLGSAWIYHTAARSGMQAADFYAFAAAYGMITAAETAFLSSVGRIARIRPKLKNIQTFFKEEPEASADKQTVTRLSGGIELNNVMFKYNDSKMIFNNLSLKIRPGEYVAVVGKTGCGKSTLVRLLLGLETPQKGGIYYDGKDISKLELKSLRRKIGIVLQDGKLFSGSIFSNIAISAPNITLDDAWAAAEGAGIAEDIKNMPMGMSTILTEGGGNVSGGQRQRILIARAIAAKPRIIIFDEATSALDNITQKTVSETLDNLKCTRIIVAHRLSTIKKCGRIIVLDGGKIAEDGSYDSLLEQDGLFAELVRRQEII